MTMTKTELILDLQSKPDVLHIVNDNPKAVNQLGDVNWYDIPIVRLLGDNFAQGASQPIIVIGEGTAQEVAYYNAKKNFSESQRQPHFTNTQYKQGIESKFTGWKALDLSVKIDGDIDMVTVKGSNGTDFVTQQIAVWKEGAETKFEMVK